MKRKNLIRLLLALAALFTFLGSVHAQHATTLETKYRQLQNKLANNQFRQPVYMDSSQQSNTISGDIYSVVNYPYSTVRTALDTPTEWCEGVTPTPGPSSRWTALWAGVPTGATAP